MSHLSDNRREVLGCHATSEVPHDQEEDDANGDWRNLVHIRRRSRSAYQLVFHAQS